MPGTNRSIGGRGNEQGGPNMGNDISRNISREVQADDTPAEVIKKDKNKKAQQSKTEGEQNNPQQEKENEDETGQ